MIDLIRRDPAVRSLPRWLLIAPLFASMMEGVRTLSYFTTPAANTGLFPPQTVLVALSMWLPLSAFLLFGRVGQRCSRLDLGMPLPARQLWWSHLAASLLAGTAIVIAEMVVIWLRHGLVAGVAPGIRASTTEAGEPLVPLLAALILGVVALQIPDHGSYVIQPGRSRNIGGLIIVAGGFAMVVLLSVLPWPALLGSLAAAVILIVLLQRDLPASFTLVPREAAAQDPPSAPRPMKTGARPRALAVARPGFLGGAGRALAVLRIYSGGVAPGQMIKFPPTLMGIPVIFAWGLLLSGFFVGPEVAFLFLTLSSYILFAFVPAQASQVYILDALPISRRALFAGLVLPGLVIMGAGFVSGAFLRAWAEPVPAVAYQAGSTRLFPETRHEQPLARVPYAACQVTWSGETPLIASPWGETHPAWSEPLFKGESVQLYSPYASREESSTEFQALMISRAIHDIYGHEIAPEEISRRYLAEGYGRPSLERDTSTLLTDYPQLQSPLSPRPAPLYFLVVALLYLLMVAIYTRALRAEVSDLGRKVYMFSLLGAVFLLHVVQLTLAIANLLEIDVLGGLLLIGSLYLVETVPGGLMGLWALCLLLTLIGYRWAESCFQRIEAPMGPLCRGGGEAL